jgi:hypothetical protein
LNVKAQAEDTNLSRANTLDDGGFGDFSQRSEVESDDEGLARRLANYFGQRQGPMDAINEIEADGNQSDTNGDDDLNGDESGEEDEGDEGRFEDEFDQWVEQLGDEDILEEHQAQGEFCIFEHFVSYLHQECCISKCFGG